MVDKVSIATLRAQLEPGGFQTGARAVKQSSDEMNTSVERVTTTTQKAGKEAQLTAEGFQKFLGRIDEATRSGQQYAREQDMLNRYMQAGVVSTHDLTVATEALKHRYQETAVAGSRFGGVLSTARGLLGQLGIAFSVASAVQFGRKLFDDTAALSEQAQQLGVNVEALQAYRGIALTSGVATETLDRSLAKLNDTIGEAISGDKQAQAALAALGVTQADYVRGVDGALPIIARHVEQLRAQGREGEVAAQINDALGKSGYRLVTMLNQLTGEMEVTIQKGKELGFVLSQELTTAADQASDRMDAAWARMKVGLAPVVVEVANLITGFTQLQLAARAFAALMPSAFGSAMGGFMGAGAPTLATPSAAPVGFEDIVVQANRSSSGGGASRSSGGGAAAQAVDINTQINRLLQESVVTVRALQDAAEKRNYTYSQFFTKLQQEVDLAHLSREEQEIQKTLMEGRVALGDRWNETEAERVRLLVQQSQEIEKQRALVDGLNSALKGTVAGGIKDAMLGRFDPKAFGEALIDNFADYASKSITENLWSSLFGSEGIGGFLGLGGKPDGSSPAKALHVTMAGGVLGAGGAPGSGGGGLGSLFDAVWSIIGGGPNGPGLHEAGHIAGFASGGNFAAGQTIRVGEMGPEVVRFGTAGRVYPHGANDNGITINQNIDARGATPGMEKTMARAAKVAAFEAVREAAPYLVSSSVQAVNNQVRANRRIGGKR